jgi:hypothetical protein
MEIQLKKFDMNMIDDTSVVVFIGKRKTGKSFLIRDLLYHKRSFPIATVISATEGANCFYSDMIPSIFIHTKFSDELVGNVLKRQEMIKAQNKVRKAKGMSVHDERTVFVMDDMMAMKNKWVRSEQVASMFCNGRHYNCLFLLSLQYVMGIPPDLRNNVDWVFILRENIHKSKKKLYENWAGIFPKFDMFDSVLNQCTENFECIVIKANSNSNKIEECVFWYKAEPHEDCKLCLPKYWEMDQQINMKKQQHQTETIDENEEVCILSVNDQLEASRNSYRVKKH